MKTSTPCILALLIAFSCAATASAQQDIRKQRAVDAGKLFEAWQIAGALPEGVFVRVSAHMWRTTTGDEKARKTAQARGVPFQKSLDELWEFTATEVHRVTYEYRKEKSLYHRVESHPLDSKNLCKDLVEGQAAAIDLRDGTGKPVHYVGTDFQLGGRSIEILRNDEEILHLGEHCTCAGYPESDARAFAALYQKLASQARALFKQKPDGEK
jgi:hypothetical protein